MVECTKKADPTGEGYQVFDVSRTQEILQEAVHQVARELKCSKDLAYAILFKNSWSIENAIKAPFPDLGEF